MQLGHRRLSIIDLSSAADQPLTKHGLTLVYNGELYNYRALRAELVSRGVRFVTKSDTEVVLEAWRAWGPEALRRFRGMFAFALFDERSGELILARDPLGIKPLYFLPRGEGVVFASELKALVAAIGLRAADRARRPRGVHALLLAAGAAVRDRRRGKASRRLLGAVPPGRKLPDPVLLAGRRSGRRGGGRAASRSGRGDRGVGRRPSGVRRAGVQLPVSGGLDSSIVTVLAHRDNPGIDAYTIAFRREDQRLEAMPDDAVYARKVAAQYGIKLHEIEISPDIVGMLPRIVDVLDEPIGDPAAINTLLMCEAARGRGVKVILSGHGRRRAVRRVPQAPRVRHGQQLRQAAGRSRARACDPP